MLKTLIGEALGYETIVSEHVLYPEQVIFPRSKKKRIMKKFSKDKRNYIDSPASFFYQGRFYVHPHLYVGLQK